MSNIVFRLFSAGIGRLAAGVCLVSILSGVGHALGAQVEPRAIMDNNGGAQPMVAATISLPQQWQSQGGIVWGVADYCNRYGYNFDWRANSPDGNYGIMILPQIFWSTMQNPIPGTQSYCLQGSFSEARQFLEWYVSNTLPGARILDYRARPDLLTDQNRSVGKTDYGSFSMISYVDAGEIIFAFDQNGQEMHGLIAVSINGSVTDMPGMAGVPGMQFNSGNSAPIFAAYAPSGQLNPDAAESIRKSIAPNPQWVGFIQQHQAKITQTNVQGAADRSRIISKSHNEISNIITDTYNNNNAVRDQLQRETSEMFRGVETYRDPVSGEAVELDSMNNNAWRLDDGSYATTNDPSFNPYESFGMGGEEMQLFE